MRCFFELLPIASRSFELLDEFVTEASEPLDELLVEDLEVVFAPRFLFIMTIRRWRVAGGLSMFICNSKLDESQAGKVSVMQVFLGGCHNPSCWFLSGQKVRVGNSPRPR